tara:strand:+ start:612 stop:3317 length:2706 start_codon:yes stop_codon:yes gene_type:complete
MEILLLTLLIPLTILVVMGPFYVAEIIQKKLEKQRTRRALIKQLQNLNFQKIDDFFSDLKKFHDQNIYISNFDLFIFKSKFKKLYDEFKEINIPEDMTRFNLKRVKVKRFKSAFENMKEEILPLNRNFLKNKLSNSSGVGCTDDLLSNVEGNALDFQQRGAIYCDEDNILVIAGAGSGKTTTIAGKVKYLTKRLNINSEKILLISFTKTSADEMEERIKKTMNIPISVKTFHKLGLDIISDVELEKPSIFSLNQKQKKQIIQSYINNLASNDVFINKFVTFLTYLLVPPKDDFINDSQNADYLKEQNLTSYKKIEKTDGSGGKIIYDEVLRSQEEVYIARFLYKNQIEYKYEERYEYKTASKKFGQYKPDFYLPKYKIYIEHFGIDKSGNPAPWFKNRRKYIEGIKWKREEHRKSKTKLIETYSWQQKEGTLLRSLQEKLEKEGIIFNPIPQKELYKLLKKNKPREIEKITELMLTFLELYKNNNENIENLYNKASNERERSFLDLFKYILKKYEDYLKKEEEIDFSDMINMATKFILNNKYKSKYEYIIIDEFQDISKSRYNLVKALLDQKPSTKLFCVGDDWQSIYRFAGSDIGLFTNFVEHFKSSTLEGYSRSTSTYYIETTYRFGEKLIDISTDFILQNPNQIKKELKCNSPYQTFGGYGIKFNNPLQIHTYNDPKRNNEKASKTLNNVLESIISSEDSKAKYFKEKGYPAYSNIISILILGRYYSDKKIIDNSQNIIRHKQKATNYTYDGNNNATISFSTIHSSKGLEADYIIILNCNSGTYGFPSEILDDPLLNFLLSKSDQFQNGEERRLFYVAMTRAKREVHILSNKNYQSKFVKELNIEMDENVSQKKLNCKWCDNGELIKKIGPYGEFLSCNNFGYCNYTEKILEKTELNS